MLINELPDDCLLAIFDHVNYLDDLMNCYKVSIKWSHLIAERTKKVKCLVGNPVNSFDCVHYQDVKSFDGTFLTTLFSNLMIAQLSYTIEKRVALEDVIALIRNQKCLKGLIYQRFFSEEPIAAYCDNLEMLACDYIEPSIKQKGANIKQLRLGHYTLDRFKEDAHYFPNLKRLHIYNEGGSPSSYYDGPSFEKLKIFEYSSMCNENDYYHSFQFMDSCPNLQSANIEVNSNRLIVDESLKHNCLQDLVITSFYKRPVNWSDLKRLSMKYPNLKHLAIRSFINIVDENIEQLVQILPNLVLLDVTGCDGVTQIAADYVQDVCKCYGRSIKFYFNGNRHEIESDWPHLSIADETICRGFDFMKHYFRKRFPRTPYFLIPIDY